jgi:hypothetical protein
MPMLRRSNRKKKHGAEICDAVELGSVGIQDSHSGLFVIQALDGPIRFD